MASKIDLDIDLGIVVQTSTVEKRTAWVIGGLAFIVGTVCGYALKTARIVYLKKKHDFFDRQAKKAKEQLLNS